MFDCERARKLVGGLFHKPDHKFVSKLANKFDWQLDFGFAHQPDSKFAYKFAPKFDDRFGF